MGFDGFHDHAGKAVEIEIIGRRDEKMRLTFPKWILEEDMQRFWEHVEFSQVTEDGFLRRVIVGRLHVVPYAVQREENHADRARFPKKSAKPRATSGARA